MKYFSVYNYKATNTQHNASKGKATTTTTTTTTATTTATMMTTTTTMGHKSWSVKEEKQGVDIGYTSSNMRPDDGEGCVGKHGIDKTYSFDQVREIAYRMNPRPNIIVKGGKNAKWYLKYFPEETIEHEIEKTRWRSCPNHTMYIMTSCTATERDPLLAEAITEMMRMRIAREEQDPPTVDTCGDAAEAE